jgi:hypothetical protein
MGWFDGIAAAIAPAVQSAMSQTVDTPKQVADKQASLPIEKTAPTAPQTSPSGGIFGEASPFKASAGGDCGEGCQCKSEKQGSTPSDCQYKSAWNAGSASMLGAAVNPSDYAGAWMGW